MPVTTSSTSSRLKQGAHPDPQDPHQPRPDPRAWSERRRTAFASREMQLYRRGLLSPDGDDLRSGVLDDLSTYFHLSPEDCVQRCINWEQWSIEEWQREQRDTPERLAAFYHSTQSWAFDLLWYAYLQAEGFEYPVSTAMALTLPPARRQLSHLDFGSGVGTTSQFFLELGFETHLADISTSLLDFARFRLERRGQTAGYIDLNTTPLPPGRFDVITAVDTLVHVPDLLATARMLHQSLRPGGYLFANFDVRPKTAENAWHLYEDDLPLRWQLQRVGFEPEESLDGMITRYRRVEARGAAHALRGVRDAILLKSPLRPAYRSARAALHSARSGRA